jgi:hypothetical protein
MRKACYILTLRYDPVYEKDVLWLLARLGKQRLLRWETAGAAAGVCVRARLGEPALRLLRAFAEREGITSLLLVRARFRLPAEFRGRSA